MELKNSSWPLQYTKGVVSDLKSDPLWVQKPVATGHTPGPWVAAEWVDNDAALAGYSISANGFLLPLSTAEGDIVEAEANARLIAAAPELLEALQALRLAREQDKCRSWEKGVPYFAKAEALADAAIAKATGIDEVLHD
jgi:hypothetical protein